jgi:hypothetical protein
MVLMSMAMAQSQTQAGVPVSPSISRTSPNGFDEYGDGTKPDTGKSACVTTFRLTHTAEGDIVSPVLSSCFRRQKLTQGRPGMKIFGKSLSEYAKFESGFLILVLVVGLARLILSLAGVPNAKVKFLSITIAFLLGALYYSIKTFTSGFGSYKQLLPLMTLPVILGNLIIISGIILAIFTNKDNIFSAPEYANHVDGKSWGHVGGHVVVMFIVPLILWVLGAWFMFIGKKMYRGPRPA